MTIKITAALLLATALPFSKVYAHSGSLERAPIQGYMYFMLTVGAVYFLFLVIRIFRRKQQNHQINSSNK